MPKLSELSQAGKEDLALALLLLRDFKKDEPKAVLNMFSLADTLGVTKELNALIPKLPPMIIVPR
jgi:hypothetical protein